MKQQVGLASGCLLAAIVSTSAAVPAQRESSTPPDEATASAPAFTRHLEFVGAGDVLLADGDFCTRTSSDTAECSGQAIYAGVGLAVRARLWPAWSAGVRGAYSWASWSDGIDRSGHDARVQYRLARLSADARWHIRGYEAIDPFLELDLGLASSWSGVRTDAGTAASPGTTVPMIGTALGLKLALSRYFSLGGALRAQLLPFAHSDLAEQRQSGSPLSGPVMLYSLSLALAVSSFPFDG
jgi:hypothetical protein